MNSSEPCFTRFIASTNGISLPVRFTFPFYYQPHPLCEQAAHELQHRLDTQIDWIHDFGLVNDSKSGTGKMFGVLVVKNSKGELGYLSAFSGKIADQNLLPGFVPPVFDMLSSDSFFRSELAEITHISNDIKQCQANPKIAELETKLLQQSDYFEQKIASHRQAMVEQRAHRKQQRLLIDENDATNQAALIQLGRESVAEKNDLKQLKAIQNETLSKLQYQLSQLTDEITAMLEQRKAMSNALQHKLFEQYQFLNQAGVEKSLNAIFNATSTPVPPAGSGECAAPKLLQYAFTHQLEPVCLAEFWWGVSPKSEIRQHKKYYPSCQSKCLPILTHMLEGIELDPNPLLENPAEGKEIDIVYQDDAIVVVNKPAEFLSVPGKHIHDSVATRLAETFSDAEGPFVIHRLDMSTSGLLVFALTRRANKSLQKQFITRVVEKRYVALIEGQLTQQSGDVSLPLRGDLYDRPRQLVCVEHGKAAETHWEKIATTNGRTKVYLYPKTGRTHQLRVHCAHQDGLNMPIVGDDLYGKKSNRLHLHAESLAFEHPYSKERMHFQVDADF
ncbi:RNA pseudouridine synthase [Vibrio genomosp. F10 str. ZF-129]|uniref:RNA pseudouridine synthase n=1 Tax=Vibrio genomosp. F10 str. ZF-129 TaxID=1187848 RepID=A0A1E5BGD7_9VIBR|nr:RluA family pseudouridine synthase [Vibrio genomosp. F10]OEE34503.1 RNA pseudouridine synthase [Vibrio genomosp. F10 str. ZF-129]